jgi:hypothetical protein
LGEPEEDRALPIEAAECIAFSVVQADARRR